MHPFLQHLLAGQAVEWKPLGEVGAVRMCKRILKEQTSSDGEIPFYKIGTFGKAPDAFISRELFEEYREKYNYPKKGDVLISASGTIGRTVIFDGQDAYFQDSNIVWIENDESLVLNKYLFYFYQIANWGVSEGGTIQRLYNDNLRKVKIPIPPLSVQIKIAEILDKFTVITAELTAELNMRNQQYQYYRDKLLSENELAKVGFEWKTLGEVGELIRGNGLTKKDLLDDGVPAIHYGQIYTHFGTFASQTKSFTSPEVAKKLRKAQYGDVLIAGTSENVQDVMKPVGWFGSEIVFSGDMFAFRPNSTVMTKYLTYMLQTTAFAKFKEKHAQGTKVIRIKTDNFLNHQIPIPPLSEQARIVAILDKFDTLTQSITEGLPREIELRQKQYEYYREQLLGFERE